MINNYRAFGAIERSAPPSFSCRRVNEGSINKMEDNRGKFFVLNCIFLVTKRRGGLLITGNICQIQVQGKYFNINIECLPKSSRTSYYFKTSY